MTTGLLLIVLIITLPGTLYLLFVNTFGVIGLVKKDTEQTRSNIKAAKLAIVIPAHNESKNLIPTLECVKHLESPEGTYEVFVIADNCTDDTAEIAEIFGATVLVRDNNAQKGKGYALSYAFENLSASKFDGYIVIDADTQCSGNIVVEIESHLSQGNEIVQGLNLVFEDPDNEYSQITNMGFLSMNYLRPIARQAARLSSGILGNGFMLSRAVLKNVPYSAESIVEDIEYHLLLLKAGYKSYFDKNIIVTSQMPANRTGAETQRSRWEGGRLNLILDKLPYLIKLIFTKHWQFIEPAFELLLLPISIHIVLILILFFSPDKFVQYYAITALVLVVCYTAIGIFLGKNRTAKIKTLCSIPKYICWKLLLLGKVFTKSFKNTSWDRTDRD